MEAAKLAASIKRFRTIGECSRPRELFLGCSLRDAELVMVGEAETDETAGAMEGMEVNCLRRLEALQRSAHCSFPTSLLGMSRRLPTQKLWRWRRGLGGEAVAGWAGSCDERRGGDTRRGVGLE